MIVQISLGVLVLVPAFLVFSEKYEDGLIGRIALALIATASTAGLLSHVGSDWDPAGATQMLLVGCALFFLRHAWRFHVWSRTGSGDWRGAARNRRADDRQDIDKGHPGGALRE